MTVPESLNDALIECVKACGGSKKVGHTLWPGKTVDAAQRHLLACLNEDKPERLCPDDLLHLLRLARAVGCHSGVEYIAEALGYAKPQPIEPKDELGDLLRQYLQQRDQDKNRDERLQRLIADHLKARAVA
jgi:hypothetical protein